MPIYTHHQKFMLCVCRWFSIFFTFWFFGGYTKIIYNKNIKQEQGMKSFFLFRVRVSTYNYILMLENKAFFGKEFQKWQQYTYVYECVCVRYVSTCSYISLYVCKWCAVLLFYCSSSFFTFRSLNLSWGRAAFGTYKPVGRWRMKNTRAF